MSAFQSTKCSNVLKSDKYGKCTHASAHTQSADTYANTYTHAPLQTPSPSPMPPLWRDGWNFESKNNRIIHRLFIYYLALHNTEVLFKGIDKGEEKQGGKNPRNKTHASVVTSSLPCLTPLTWKWGTEGFGFNQHNELRCWLSDTVNADNKLWKACHCLPKGSSQWPYELTTVMGAEMVIVIFTAQSLLISFSSFLKKLSPQNPEIKSWKQSWIG